MKKQILFPVIALVLTACGGGNEGSDTPAEKNGGEELKAQVCSYSYDHSSTKVMWEAYKFTSRAGVGGTMDSVEVSGTKVADSPEAALHGAAFRIFTTGINSGDASRDEKIGKHFFGSLKDGDVISGTIKSLDANSGKATIALSLNGVSRETTMDCSLKNGNEWMLSGTIDMSDWDGTGAVDALNAVCKDLHTGDDGVSKLWPDVKLTLFTTLKKECE